MYFFSIILKSNISNSLSVSRVNIIPYSGRLLSIQSKKNIPMKKKDQKEYWRRNIRLLFICMFFWFFFSYVTGIILVDQLNQIQVGGFKLGFWFAQQGSIYFFVALIFFYSWRMNKIEKEFDFNEKES